MSMKELPPRPGISWARGQKAKRDPLIERRCIGCGKFIRPNLVMQCADCDDREPVDRFYDSSGIYGG